MDSPALFTAINSHLIRRGFRAGEIPQLLKNVFSIINEKESVVISEINEELVKRNFPEGSIDETAYDLIKQILVNEIKNY